MLTNSMEWIHYSEADSQIVKFPTFYGTQNLLIYFKVPYTEPD